MFERERERERERRHNGRPEERQAFVELLSCHLIMSHDKKKCGRLQVKRASAREQEDWDACVRERARAREREREDGDVWR